MFQSEKQKKFKGNMSDSIPCLFSSLLFSSLPHRLLHTLITELISPTKNPNNKKKKNPHKTELIRKRTDIIIDAIIIDSPEMISFNFEIM